MSIKHYAGDDLVAHWDDERRRFFDYTTDPPTDRPYTDAENAEADLRAEMETRVANEFALRDGLQNVIDRAETRQESAQAIINTANREIRDNPVPHILTLARICLRQDRDIIRLSRLAGGLLDTDDLGLDE